MKKTLSLLTALLLILSLCACGAKDHAAKDEAEVSGAACDPEVIRSNYDKALVYVNSLMNTQGMVESDQDDEGGTSLYHYWSYETKVENSDFSMDITLDGKDLTIGTTTVKDLQDMGLTLSDAEDTVEAGSAARFTVDKGNCFCNLAAANTTGTTAKTDTLPVSEIITTGGEYAVPFSYGSIQEGSDLKAVLAALGTPNFIATLSADEADTSITLEYFRETSSDNGLVNDYLNIYMTYDAEQNTAALVNLTLGRTID